MTEREDAIKLANKVLDTPGRDPDDDLSVLARQFQRLHDELSRVAWLVQQMDSAGGVGNEGECGHRRVATFAFHSRP